MVDADEPSAAEQGGFEVLITTDTTLRYRQNLAHRAMAIVVPGTTNWPRTKLAAAIIGAALDSITAGDDVEAAVP